MRQRQYDPFSPHGRRVTMDQMLDPAFDPKSGNDWTLTGTPSTGMVTITGGGETVHARADTDGPLQWFYEDSDAPDDGLSQMRRTDLVKLAEERGIKSYGNRDALLARIRAHKQD